MFIVKIKKLGGSKIIVIPREIVKELKILEKDKFLIYVDKKKRIVLKRF